MFRRRTGPVYEQQHHDLSDVAYRVDPVADDWLLVSKTEKRPSGVVTTIESIDAQCSTAFDEGSPGMQEGGANIEPEEEHHRKTCLEQCIRLNATPQHMIDTLGAPYCVKPMDMKDLVQDFRSGARLVAAYSPSVEGLAAADAMPTVLSMYIIRAGDASIAGERLAEFDLDTSSKSARRATNVSPEAVRLIQADQRKRTALEAELRCATHEASLWRSRCLECGLDPDAVRARRTSSISEDRAELRLSVLSVSSDSVIV
ncbi:hypothetical protein LTR56_014339 [Elasticomyces elasticus]|nr:hypothetical protein LTR56_014339 [Elasticomyces elasticus]KAK3636373.1 hypothetical protein LTR22_018749 [Elasticomyces elasticus]KAK4916595.1 hypothetical protein LTR49_015428 [Elasticomyces elasticus]KAK5756168.1 hypothetical protein LTS12_013721 [Elasticomyces elasticus]